MTRCYFIDVDDTIFKKGSEEPLFEGVIDKINALPGEVWLFTCRPPRHPWVQQARRLGLRFEGIIHKPLADEYILVDDKLVAASASLEPL
jgi:hypothetical protein